MRDALVATGDEAVALAQRFAAVNERLLDLDELRLDRMDRSIVDLQVLSVTTPGTQPLPASQATDLARRANDVAAAAARRHPDRFAAFATLLASDLKSPPRSCATYIFDARYPEKQQLG